MKSMAEKNNIGMMFIRIHRLVIYLGLIRVTADKVNNSAWNEAAMRVNTSTDISLLCSVSPQILDWMSRARII